MHATTSYIFGELVAKQDIRIERVETELQHADVLANPLQMKLSKILRNFLLNHSSREYRISHIP